ncbi:MAG: hypothetical protein ACT4OJ_01930 [Bacteroidota bacterium]
MGYSENVLSLLLEIFQLTGKPEPVTILQNIDPELKRTVPFMPAGMKVEIVKPNDPFKLPERFCTCLGVYNPHIKSIVYEWFFKKYDIAELNYTNLLHPSSVIASSAVLNKGIHVEPLSVVSPFAELSFGVSVNRKVSIGHHTRIGRFTTIGPGADIGGNSRIMDHVQIGMGAVIFNDVRIGQHTIIGGGSVVTSDIPDNVIAWGNPCKVIKPVTAG